MDILFKNIKSRRLELNMSQGELAQKIGYKDRSAIAHIESGKKNLTQSKIAAFAKALNTTPAYLMGWEDGEESLNFDNLIPIKNFKKIPIVGTIACGAPILAEQNLEGYTSVADGINADFALRCKGDSMVPRFIDGDIVLIRQQPTVENGQIAAVLVENEATLKRVYIDTDEIILSPENGAYRPMTFRAEKINDIKILGLVIGYTRLY